MKLCGTMPFIIEFHYEHLFAIRSIVYPLTCAEKGKLYPVAIKKVCINPIGEFTYIDSFNRVWLENELKEFEEAKEIAIAYLEEQIELTANSVCSTI